MADKDFAEVIRDAARKIMKAPMRAPEIVVHPAAHAWARDPSGPPPNADAVELALRMGTMTVERAKAEGWWPL